MRGGELLPCTVGPEIVAVLESFRDTLRERSADVAVFDHPESTLAELPEVVRRYHAARTAWLATLGTQAPRDVATVYATATNDLWAEVERQGGRWKVGRLEYRIGKRGLSIEQEVETEPEPVESVPAK